MKHPAYPFAVIAWDDAHGDASVEIAVEELDAHHKGARYQSYGWLLRSDDKGVSLAPEWSCSDGKYRDVMFIPRGMILEEQLLILTPPRKSRGSRAPKVTQQAVTLPVQTDQSGSNPEAPTV